MAHRIPIKKNVFIKLFIVFLIIIIVFYVISISINTIGMKKVQNEISELIGTELSYNMNAIENETRNILKVQSVFLNDVYLNKLSGRFNTLSDYESIELVKNIHSRISIMAKVGTFVKKVSIHMPELSKAITTDEGYCEINNDEVSALKSKNSLNGVPLIHWNNNLYLSVKYPILESGSNSILYMITIEVSKKVLYDKLDTLVAPNGGYFVLRDIGGGWEISNSSNMSVYSELDKYVQSIKTDDKRLSLAYKMDRVKLSNQYYWVMAKKSEYMSTLTLICIPEKKVLQPIESFRPIIWILSFFSMFVLAVFGMWL